MKKLTISTFLALSVLAFTGTSPSLAQTTAQAQISEQSQLMLEKTFKELSQRERTRIQSQLSEYGLYASTLDGLWGRNTANALHQAATMMEQNMGGELNLASAGPAKAFLNQFIDGSASAFMWGEGGECDGCGEEGQQQPFRQAENTVLLPKNFQCNSLPRAYQAGNIRSDNVLWIDLNEQLSTLFAKMEGATQRGDTLNPTDMRKVERIIEKYEIPYAAEFYGYALYDAGDLKGAHELWATAAIHGEPSSTTLLTISLMGGYDEFKHLEFVNAPNAETIADCLRYAASAKDDSAMVWLAAGLVGDPDVPTEIRNVLGIDTSQARRLVNSISQESRDEWAEEDIAAILRLADEADQKRRTELASNVADTANELTSTCNGLLTLKGICWAQTIEEMKTVLISQKYDCGNKQPPYDVCRQDDAVIDFYNTEVSFNCEVFNACAFDFQEVSKFIIEQGIVNNLESSREMKTPDEFEALARALSGSSTPRMPYWLHTNCGKGPKGQELCVEQPEDGEVRLVLRRDTFGAAIPSFD